MSNARHRRWRSPYPLVAAAVGATVLAGTAPVSATSAFAFGARLAGASRFDTAAAVAGVSFSGHVDNVVLVNGETAHAVDALSANYLAGALQGAVLLTKTDVTPQTTLDRLASMTPKAIYVLGGTLAVSDTQIAALKAKGYTNIKRFFGQTRYDTNLVANESAVAGAPGTLADANGVQKRTAIIARGDLLPDALAAGALAYGSHLPLILTSPTALTLDAKAQLRELGIQQVIIMGGPLAITQSVETAIGALNITVRVRAGATGQGRSYTSYALANFERAHVPGWSSSGLTVASGADAHLVDALSGSQYAGLNKLPILITTSATSAGSVTTYAAENASTLTTGRIFGGDLAVSSAVESAILNAARGTSSQDALTVTPADAQTVGQGSHVDYSVIGLSPGKYTVGLFACGNVTLVNGVRSFAQTSPGSGVAAIGQIGNNELAIVNGVTQTGSVSTANVAASAGAITFTVSNADSNAAPSCVVPVVFVDDAATTQLTVNGDTGTPTIIFGAGGGVTFAPPAASSSPIQLGVVNSVDKAAGNFTATTSGSTNTYGYKPTDTYQNEVGGACVNTSQADFLSRLSKGDGITGTYSTNAASVFCLADNAPLPPQALAVIPPSSAADTSATVVVSDSRTDSVSSYVIYRALAADFAQGTCPVSGSVGATFAAVGSASDSDPTSATSGDQSFSDTGLTADTTYCYAATAVDVGGQESSNASYAAAYSTSQSPTLPPPMSSTMTYSDANTDGALDSGDILRVTFAGALPTPTSYSMTLTDKLSNSVVIDGTNSQVSESSGVLTFTLKQNPAVVGGAGPLQFGNSPLEVKSESGISDSAGSEWCLVLSGTRVFGGSNAALPVAPTVTASSAASGTVTVTTASGDIVVVYNSTGAVIGTATATNTSTVVATSPGFGVGDTLYVTRAHGTSAQESQTRQVTAGA